eukprot:TRINITY_DN48904_c0_g1_i1.p1 TRINITY_DN48904_c0_g1~~TRINITY_DN48904_c0_g1_i1.p1  ORF type:complete len:260 (+),score=98.46 TRINITY_DN48904_c0_g1_i1:248-1027(+)
MHSSRVSEQAAPEPVVGFKAQPMPEFKRVFLPKSSQSKLTEVVPFQFPGDKFHAKAQMEFDAKKKAAEEEEARHRDFKAQPIREYQFHSGANAQANAPQLTEVAPFNLNSDVRHAEYQRKRAEELARQEHEDELARSFRAIEPTVLVKSPFVPKKSNKPLTEISNFALKSDQRAAEREQFDLEIQKKLEETDRLKKEQEFRQLEEDKAAIAELRATQMSFKANPVRYSNMPFTAKPSEQSLTTPYSPALMTKSRSNMAK